MHQCPHWQLDVRDKVLPTLTVSQLFEHLCTLSFTWEDKGWLGFKLRSNCEVKQFLLVMLGSGGPVLTYSSTFYPAPPPWKHPSLASEPITKKYFLFVGICCLFVFVFMFCIFPPPEAGFGQRGYGNAIYSEGCSLCSLS